MNERTISRRTVVTTGLGVIAAPAVLRTIPANAQSRTIKIGHVSPRTGPLAGFGEADGFILEQVRGILGKGLTVGGKHLSGRRSSARTVNRTAAARRRSRPN